MAEAPKPAAKPRTRRTTTKAPPPEKPVLQGKAAVIEQLRAPFKTSEVKQREGGRGKMLDYIAIDSVINRLLDVTPDYETIDPVVELKGPIDTTRKRRDGTTYQVDCYLGVVTLVLIVEGRRHVGVGADFDEDPDKVIKTALAEAIKKAANQVGVALYLWKEEARAEVARQRDLGKGDDPAALKRELVRIATAGGVELDASDPEGNAQKLADFFQVPVDALQDAATLRGLVGIE